MHQLGEDEIAGVENENLIQFKQFYQSAISSKCLTVYEHRTSEFCQNPTSFCYHTFVPTSPFQVLPSVGG